MTMRAVVFDDTLRVRTGYPVPEPRPGWALIRVQLVGICRTDLEITQGYMSFRGVLGHEFVGTVAGCDNPGWAGARVVGEINAGCGACDSCAQGLARHCAERTVLGIAGLDGCMAEYCVLPTANLLRVPAAVSDPRAALVEPLSAACEILEQIHLRGTERAIVLGDGKLGILCAWVLATRLESVTLVGHHPRKLERAAWRGLQTASSGDTIPPGADLVVDATGSAGGLEQALALCRPRGTVVLKTTVAARTDVDLAPLVVNEQTVIGSRCGRFEDGLTTMTAFPDMPLDRLITATHPLERAVQAFAEAGRADALKILLRP